jgi:hypothetical protein
VTEIALTLNWSAFQGFDLVSVTGEKVLKILCFLSPIFRRILELIVKEFIMNNQKLAIKVRLNQQKAKDGKLPKQTVKMLFKRYSLYQRLH